MRITNQTPANTADNATTPTVRPDGASGLPAPNAPSSPSASLSTTAYNLAPSFELVRLNAALQQVPAVRPEAVDETSRLLAAGDLQSPNALAQTADAMLGGL